MIDHVISMIVPVLVVVVIVLGAGELIRAFGGRGGNGFGGGRATGRYCRGRFLSANEKEFLAKLDRVVGAQYRIFAQVRLADLVDVEGCEDRQARFEAMKAVFGKSVDFVVCDRSTLNPVLILEVDDRSHNASDRRSRDALVNRVCEEAGLRLVRVRARMAYSETGLMSLLETNGLAAGSLLPNVSGAMRAG